MIKTFDETSQRAGQRYQSFLRELDSLLMAAMFSDATDLGRRNKLQSEALEAAQSFLGDERGHITADLETLTEQAVYNDTVIPEIEMYRGEIEAFLVTEITSQAQRDIAHIMKRFGDLGLHTYLLARDKSVPVHEAQQRVLANMDFTTAFKFRDRSGKRIDAHRWAKTVYRHVMLTFGWQAFIIDQISMSVENFVLSHPNQKKGVEGLILATEPNGREPTFEDIKDDIFHPNSRVTIEGIYS